MATKAQEAAERLWEVTRHLSQGAAGPGSIFAIELDGDKLLVTINESPGVARRYTLEATSHRKVKVDNTIVDSGADEPRPDELDPEDPRRADSE